MEMGESVVKFARRFFAEGTEGTGFRMDSPSVPKTLFAGFRRPVLGGVPGVGGSEEVSLSPGSVTESFPGSTRGSPRGRTEVLLAFPFHQVPIQSPKVLRSNLEISKECVGIPCSFMTMEGVGEFSGGFVPSPGSEGGRESGGSENPTSVMLSLSTPFETVVTEGAYRLSLFSGIGFGTGVASSSASVRDSANDYGRVNDGEIESSGVLTIILCFLCTI